MLATSAKSASAAALGGLGTDPDSAWYRSLDKPGWQPPPVAFRRLDAVVRDDCVGTARMIDAEPDPHPRKELTATLRHSTQEESLARMMRPDVSRFSPNTGDTSVRGR